MAQFIADLNDVRFVLREQVNIDEIAQLKPFADFEWDDFDMVVTEAANFARNVLSPLQAVVDREGSVELIDGRVKTPPLYHEVYNAYNAGGWGGVQLNPDLGGQGLPGVIGATCMEFFIASCPSFSFIPGLAKSAGRVIEAVGTRAQVKKYCHKMYDGTWGGTMCLTEPQAGSAVGDITTSAVVQPDGQYKIRGSKIFISAGDSDLTENVIHLVLARTPGSPAGTKGISLFVVPADRADGTRNDVAITAMEEKMGIHGSPTCSISFGDENECIGEILGDEGEGMRHMFLMMNEARIAVGLQAAGIANYAYQLALGYAKERKQGVDVKSMKDPNAERVAIIEHPDVRRMLLKSKAYAEGTRALLLVTAGFADRAEHHEDKKVREMNQHLLEILTPICKAWGSYRAFDTADLAIMVHGGYGYIKEYGVEGLLRDIKIAAIYEGTNGIQALDLLGRKVARKGGLMFMTFLNWMNQFVARWKTDETVGALAKHVETSKNTLATLTMELGGMSRKGDVYYPVLCASDYLEAFGDVVVARLLVEQAGIAAEKLAAGGLSDGEKRFMNGKIKTASFYCAQQLPRVDMMAARIRSGDRSALEVEL